ncbi:hypothetical protein Tco_0503272 [Tanacetum coccineum]
MARKAKETFIEDKDPKKIRTSGNNSGASLEGIDQSFQTFVEGFNATTLATMANAMTTSMKDDNTPSKSCLQKIEENLIVDGLQVLWGRHGSEVVMWWCGDVLEGERDCGVKRSKRQP